MTEPLPVCAIVTDLDGTLLTSDKRVTPRARDALVRAREAGIRLAVASARPWRLVTQVLGSDLRLFDGAIVSNGSAIIELPSQRLLGEDLIPAEEASHLVSAMHAEWPDAGLGWELGEVFECDDAFVTISQSQRILRDPVQTSRRRPAQPIHQLVVARPGVQPTKFLEEAQRLVGEAYVITDSDGGVAELSSATVDKASAARRWAAHVDADLDQLAAFGDERNDISLLSAAALGVAMGNARDAVKEAARVTAPTNDEDGFARTLESILSGSDELRSAMRATGAAR